jgi:hypothetical protein
MNKRTLGVVLAGCAVLLCVCCVGAGIAIYAFDAPNQISRVLGLGVELPGKSSLPSIPGAVPVPGKATAVAPLSGNAPTTAPGLNLGSGLFGDAIGKAKTATKYRMEFTWAFGGMQTGKYQEEPFFNMSGMVDGKNSYLTSKGGLFAMLAADKNSTIEIIDADGKTYMKGITMFGMADPKQWYISDDKSSSGFKDFAKPDEWRSFAGGKDSDFTKAGSESVDGQSCDIWRYDLKTAQNAAITGLLGSAQDKSSFSAIDKAEVTVSLCADGYVHKYAMNYEGHDAKNANSKGALKINSHMWDFNNSAIVVTAPTGAKPMPGSK